MLNLYEIIKLCKKAISKEKWTEDAECTVKFKKVFSQYGKEQGYIVEYEGHPKEFLNLDMVWWKNARLVVAIEHENDPRSDPINDEWKKLAYTDAEMGILVTYCTPEDKRKEWERRAIEILTKKPNKMATRYFLILGDQVKHDFRGFEFDSFGNRKQEIELE
jgi:hypothetical protein